MQIRARQCEFPRHEWRDKISQLERKIRRRICVSLWCRTSLRIWSDKDKWGTVSCIPSQPYLPHFNSFRIHLEMRPLHQEGEFTSFQFSQTKHSRCESDLEAFTGLVQFVWQSERHDFQDVFTYAVYSPFELTFVYLQYLHDMIYLSSWTTGITFWCRSKQLVQHCSLELVSVCVQANSSMVWV